MHDYDESWSQWLDCEKYGPTLRHQRRNIEFLLKDLDYKSILDVGSGSGDNLYHMLNAKKVEDVCLIDVSSKALARARTLVPGARLVQLDIQKESVDRRFDMVLCCDVLEHIPNDAAALKNIRNMSDKYFVLSTLSGKMRESEKHVGHVRNYTLDGLLSKLKEARFKPVKVIRWGFPFYSPLYRNLWNRLPQEINYGKFGWFRRVCAQMLYLLFILNSRTKGDYLFILCESV